MNENADFDRDLFRGSLTAARQRLARDAPELDRQPDQGLAYGVFEDALDAAGYARALGEPESEVTSLLKIASRAGEQVFRHRGTLRSQITHIPSEKIEEFVDTSASNPWTFVRAIYAALAVGTTETLSYLGSLAAEAYHSDQVSASSVLEVYSRALGKAVAPGSTAEALALAESLETMEEGSDETERYWLAQAKVLREILRDDPAGFRGALEKLDRPASSYYVAHDLVDSPERFLNLPLLGLEALGRRMDSA